MRQHQDITQSNLSLAFLDQRVEGAYRDTPHCYMQVLVDGAWCLGLAVANEQGYNPIGGLHYYTQDEARTVAHGMNDHLGLDDETVCAIICSTMGGKPYVAQRKAG